MKPFPPDMPQPRSSLQNSASRTDSSRGELLWVQGRFRTKKDSGSARQGETANTRNVQPPESP